LLAMTRQSHYICAQPYLPSTDRWQA